MLKNVKMQSFLYEKSVIKYYFDYYSYENLVTQY